MTTGAVNPLQGYNPPSIFSPSIFDVVVIGGATCPGIVKLSGFERKWKWDKKGGKGASGVTPTMTGKDECTGVLKFFVWTGLQFVLWEGFRPQFKYDPTKQTLQAVSVYHPVLADLDIASLFCEHLSPFLEVSPGLWSCEDKMSEFTPVPKAAAVATPTQAKSNTPPPGFAGFSGPPPLDATTALQQKTADLIAVLSAP